MLTFEEALRTVLDSAQCLGSERIDITLAINQILAEDVKSDMDMPPFNKSAMDGYACRRADLANELEVVETIPAGYTPTKSIEPNQCAKIMTGASVPQGADCVVMVEFTENPTDSTVRFVGEDTSDNICQKGEDIKAGQVVLPKGTRIRPQHIAVLASVGCAQPVVSKRPRVGILATGDELVQPECRPGPSQIRNSNSFQLAAQVESMGAVAKNYGIAKDTDKAIDNMFKEAVEENDVVLVSGGVSMGDYDLVPGIFRQNKIDLLFEKVAIKPGKPTVFGVSENIYCFGLPGNPVSTFILFELLVKPFLYKLMCYDYKSIAVKMPLAESFKRKKVDRQTWIPVAFTNSGLLKPVSYHGSAHINALCIADGLISIGVGVEEIEKGTIVPVRLI
ncbi:MAG: molybdopterin molybdotransferase MoeA [Planctomycetes bacterium]|nr:molybdopterin molybdotransferase MoeA [Planctomycetota bacterium]